MNNLIKDEKMNNLIIGMDKSGSFRVYLAITTNMVETARKLHDTMPVSTAALGRVLTGAGIMGLMMKDESNKLTVQFKGNGPAKEILATATGAGVVKGYISNPHVDLPIRADKKLDVGGALGIGTITVIKDLGLKEPYMGRIDLVSGEIAEDLTAYFFISEQQSTSVALGVLIDIDGSVKASGGMIIQMMPDAREEAVDYLENMIDHMEPITTMIDKICSSSKDLTEEAVAEKLLKTIFENMPEEFQVEKLDSKTLRWECDCSVERLEQVLISVGKKDLKSIIEEDGQAELVCQFCTTKYHFDKEHLEKIYREI